jgi:tetratricopeptide (TPR) repeat protein
MRGFELSASHDARAIEEAIQRLTNAVSRDPGFALAHATLSFVCATRHFESDPARVWLEKAEFHCDRALELRPDLPEGHVSRAFLLWGPSKNFQHADAIAALKRALGLQSNLPQAYNRLGTILAHIGLLDQAEEMYRRGCAFHPRKQISRSVFQVHLWRGEFDRAGEQLEQVRNLLSPAASSADRRLGLSQAAARRSPKAAAGRTAHYQPEGTFSCIKGRS